LTTRTVLPNVTRHLNSLYSHYMHVAGRAL